VEPTWPWSTGCSKADAEETADVVRNQGRRAFGEVIDEESLEPRAQQPAGKAPIGASGIWMAFGSWISLVVVETSGLNGVALHAVS
jgi:hypothetical protein